MDNAILLVARFAVKDDFAEEFRELYAQGIATVKEAEPGVLSFDLHGSDERSVFYSVESYRDSQAILKHFALSSTRIPRILEISTVTRVEIYGDVSADVRELLAHYGTAFCPLVLGFKR